MDDFGEDVAARYDEGPSADPGPAVVNLTNQDAQVACLENVAAHLAPCEPLTSDSEARVSVWQCTS